MKKLLYTLLLVGFVIGGSVEVWGQCDANCPQLRDIRVKLTTGGYVDVVPASSLGGYDPNTPPTSTLEICSGETLILRVRHCDKSNGNLRDLRVFYANINASGAGTTFTGNDLYNTSPSGLTEITSDLSVVATPNTATEYSWVVPNGATGVQYLYAIQDESGSGNALTCTGGLDQAVAISPKVDILKTPGDNFTISQTATPCGSGTATVQLAGFSGNFQDFEVEYTAGGNTSTTTVTNVGSNLNFDVAISGNTTLTIDKITNVEGGGTSCEVTSFTNSSISLTVDTPPEAGNGTGIEVCNSGTTTVNLEPQISGNSASGTWTAQSGPSPTDSIVDVSGIGAGTLTYVYTVSGGAGACSGSSDTAQVKVYVEAPDPAGGPSNQNPADVCTTDPNPEILLRDLLTGETGGTGGSFNDLNGAQTDGATTSGVAQNPTYNFAAITQTKSYNFTYTKITQTGVCSGESDTSPQITVNVTYPGNPGDGSSTEVCRNGSSPSVNLNTLLNNQTSGGDWKDINDNTISPNIDFSQDSATGVMTYYYEVGSGNCTDTTQVKVRVSSIRRPGAYCGYSGRSL